MDSDWRMVGKWKGFCPTFLDSRRVWNGFLGKWRCTVQDPWLMWQTIYVYRPGVSKKCYLPSKHYIFRDWLLLELRSLTNPVMSIDHLKCRRCAFHKLDQFFVRLNANLFQFENARGRISRREMFAFTCRLGWSFKTPSQTHCQLQQVCGNDWPSYSQYHKIVQRLSDWI